MCNEDKKKKITSECLVIEEALVLINLKLHGIISMSFHQQSANLLVVVQGFENWVSRRGAKIKNGNMIIWKL